MVETQTYGDLVNWPLMIGGYFVGVFITIFLMSYIMGCRVRRWEGHRNLYRIENDWDSARMIVSMLWPFGIPIFIAIMLLVGAGRVLRWIGKNWTWAGAAIVLPFVAIAKGGETLGKKYGCWPGKKNA